MVSLEVMLVHQKVKLAGKGVDFCKMVVDALAEVVNLVVLSNDFLGVLAVGHDLERTAEVIVSLSKVSLSKARLSWRLVCLTGRHS